MAPDTELQDFVRISRYLGADPAYVQGGGGNTSAKTAARMLVKASGLTLGEVREDHGYADVDYHAIRAYLDRADADEDMFNAAVISTNAVRDMRPSMETGFHAVLDGFVLHSHSVYANVLTCAREGARHMAALVPDAVWVPYVSPGRALTLYLKEISSAQVFFLQNHGLIVRAAHAEAAIATHEAVNASLREALDLPAFDPDVITPRPRAFMDAHILFPDQVIYTNPASPFGGTHAEAETLAAYAYIHDRITAAGLTPHYLRRSDAAFLLGMDAEKFRGKVGTA